MFINKFITMVLLVLLSSLALAQQDKPTALINEEENVAKLACEYIKQDAFWKNLTSSYSEMVKVSLTYPKSYTIPGSFAMAQNNVTSLADLSMRFYSSNNEKYLNKKTVVSETFSTAISALRFNRILLQCGKDLYNAGLIFPTKPFTLRPDDKSSAIKFNDILVKASCVKQSDENLIANFRKAEKGGNPAELLNDLTGDCYNVAVSLYKELVFPYHDILPNESVNFYKSQEVNKIYEAGLADLASVKSKFITVKTEADKQAKNEGEKQSRINDVRAGNWSAAKSCSELGQALISKETFSHMLYGSPISKNIAAVYAQPDYRVFGSVNRIFAANNEEIITYDAGDTTSYTRATKIKLNNKTIWFNNNVASGTNIYVVGTYVGNETIRVKFGDKVYTANARVIEPICINSL